MKTKKNNRKDAALHAPPPDTLPILIPDKALQAIKTPDGGDYEFTEAVAFPTEGSGGVYTYEFWQSVIDFLHEEPMPGDKVGHDYEKPKDDFFTIGGAIELEEGDGGKGSLQKGVCYLRVYVPREGYDSSNEGFIRSLKAGVPELSIVACVEATQGADGRSYFGRADGKLRNDKVDVGAMALAISNRALPAARATPSVTLPPLQTLLDLARSGAIDTASESRDLIVNGKVCRKAALLMQFNGPDKALGAQVMNAIAAYGKTHARGNTGRVATGGKIMRRRNDDGDVAEGMTVDEIIQLVRTAILNNQLTLEELTKALQMENKLRNSDDEKRAKLIELIKQEMELPEDAALDEVKKAIEELLKEVEETGEAAAEAEANRLTGGRRRMNALGVEEPNEAFEYAYKQLKGLRGHRLTRAIDDLRRDRVFNRLVSQLADPYHATQYPFPAGGLRKV